MSKKNMQKIKEIEDKYRNMMRLHNIRIQLYVIGIQALHEKQVLKMYKNVKLVSL